jgi:tRNA A-37 threonylcarbamoyl transferase component Bud32
MIGRTVGNYVISAKVGQGGMGVVYRAEHPQISRTVAIKLLHPGADRNPELVHRFFNEARAATQIRNEHVVEVLDFGELPEHTPYLVMEWLEGQSLGNLLLAETKLPVARASHILLGIVRALKAAHAKGVVHRDLKPDNVFLVPREADADLVKVLDFGIAKLMAAGASRSYQTQTGAIIGTPAYMSPEQCRGAKEIDARTDIYSLGVIGYQMLTGCLPFGAAAIGELLFKQLTEQAPALASLEPSLPAPLCAIIALALEKEPDGRPSLAQLSAVLERASAGDPSPVAVAAAVAPAPAPARHAASATTLGGAASPLENERRSGVSRRTGLVVASALAVAAGLAATIALTRKPREPAAVEVATVAQPTPPARPPPPTPPPGSRATVRIAIRTEPAAAHLEVDGQSGNPFIGTVPPDERAHVVSASLPGFKMVRQSIVFDQDRDLLLTLSPAPRGGPRKTTNEAAEVSADTQSPSPASYRGSKLKIETEFPGP